jgi:hypothetical protein
MDKGQPQMHAIKIADARAKKVKYPDWKVGK